MADIGTASFDVAPGFRVDLVADMNDVRGTGERGARNRDVAFVEAVVP